MLGVCTFGDAAAAAGAGLLAGLGLAAPFLAGLLRREGGGGDVGGGGGRPFVVITRFFGAAACHMA